MPTDRAICLARQKAIFGEKPIHLDAKRVKNAAVVEKARATLMVGNRTVASIRIPQARERRSNDVLIGVVEMVTDYLRGFRCCLLDQITRSGGIFFGDINVTDFEMAEFRRARK